MTGRNSEHYIEVQLIIFGFFKGVIISRLGYLTAPSKLNFNLCWRNECASWWVKSDCTYAKWQQKSPVIAHWALKFVWGLLFIANVHCYFKAKTHFCCCWCCPHNHSPLSLFTSPLMCLYDSHHTYWFKFYAMRNT